MAQPRREVSWREWCAPEKREKMVTRGELLTWVDRIVSDIREDFTPWYVKAWRRVAGWFWGVVDRIADARAGEHGLKLEGKEPK